MACKNCKSDSVVNLLTHPEVGPPVQVTQCDLDGNKSALRICMRCDTVMFVALDDPGNWKDVN